MSAQLATPNKRAIHEVSRDLLSRGFKFVGSTICYAFMQAVGMVNDHTIDCFRYTRTAKSVQASLSSKRSQPAAVGAIVKPRG